MIRSGNSKLDRFILPVGDYSYKIFQQQNKQSRLTEKLFTSKAQLNSDSIEVRKDVLNNKVISNVDPRRRMSFNINSIFPGDLKFPLWGEHPQMKLELKTGFKSVNGESVVTTYWVHPSKSLVLDELFFDEASHQELPSYNLCVNNNFSADFGNLHWVDNDLSVDLYAIDIPNFNSGETAYVGIKAFELNSNGEEIQISWGSSPFTSPEIAAGSTFRVLTGGNSVLLAPGNNYEIQFYRRVEKKERLKFEYVSSQFVDLTTKGFVNGMKWKTACENSLDQ